VRGACHYVLLQDGTVGMCDDVIKMSFRLPYDNVEVKICRTTILPVVLCACETWSLIKRGTQAGDVRGLGLRGMFGPKVEEVIRNCIIRIFMTECY